MVRMAMVLITTVTQYGKSCICSRPYKLVMRISPRITTMSVARIWAASFFQAGMGYKSSLMPTTNKMSKAAMMELKPLMRSPADQNTNEKKKPTNNARPPKVGMRVTCSLR